MLRNEMLSDFGKENLKGWGHALPQYLNVFLTDGFQTQPGALDGFQTQSGALEVSERGFGCLNSFLHLGLLNLEFNSLLWRTDLCIIECLTASLVSTLQVPIASPSHPSCARCPWSKWTGYSTVICQLSAKGTALYVWDNLVQ